MTTTVQRVGGAILLAQQQWNPKTAKESLEVVMARAAIEAMRPQLEALKSHIIGSTGALPGSDSEEMVQMVDAMLNGGDLPDWMAE